MKKRIERKPSRKQSNQAGGSLRIIGGDFRGRKLPVMNAEGLRPTSDRVRETLFNWLQFDISGAECLDVFAGSGALGLEALSRGAKSVCFLELNKESAQQIQQNLDTLKIPGSKVIQTDSLQWLQQTPSKPFDVIFLDPPFHQGLMQPVVDLLFQKHCVKNDQAWLYLEQEKALEWPKLPNGWCCHREKTTSEVKYGLFKFEEKSN
ncbi:16S rRNA (guanine(966)-N(2))-methyltransferase RsmD [Hydrogenovibrio sp. 3SP14C1]|uniref:16S rRNA (guanine(966)-N(2))-methyltransferase RsmD n=1 Tax=Hydrogenovibrio sp. 3SP14C1 TaxID=3038774 RepID=UPI002417E03C|nr:16S rRNA (guanine(966)-N(2))-methyltransferase RsmD [Hydrogenovibrio sp. 3SP14C1]MDG4812572.1 16S rRNA (guanine(966)-N(2))-methyltransferase RsmD [Hydrogenovibrio sp. 3SP14C1]